MKHRLLAICNRFTLRFLINFTVILALPLGVFGLAYTYLNKMSHDQSYQENQIFFNQSGMMINTFFSDVQSLVSQLSNNNQIVNYLQLQNAAEDKRNLAEVILGASQLRNICKLNSSIYDLYIYSSQSGMAIGKSGIEIHRDRFWETLLPINEYTPEQLKNMAQMMKHDLYLPVTMVVNNQETPMILYMHQMQSVPFIYLYGSMPTAFSSGVLLAVFQRNALDRYLHNNYFVMQGGSVTVTDTNGTYIAGSKLDPSDQASITQMINLQTDQEIGYFVLRSPGDRFHVNYSTSPHGWRYIAVMPQSTLFSRLRVSNNIGLAIFLITFLVGLAISFFLSFRMARPLHSISQTMGDTHIGVRGDLFGAIGRYFEVLKTENKTKDQLLARQSMQTRHLILYRLLYGSFDSDNEYVAYARRHGLMPLSGSFLPILICVGTSGESTEMQQTDQLQLAKIIVREEAIKVFGTDQIEDVDYNTIVVVYHFDEIVTREDTLTLVLEKGIHELSARMKIKFGISIAAYGGTLCSTPMQISQSFRQARLTMERIAPINNGIIWFHEENQVELDYYFPAEVKKALTGSIRNGETDEMVKILERINFENTYRMQLSAESNAELAEQLRRTFEQLVRQIYSSELPENIRLMLQNLQQASRFEQILELIRPLGREISEDINRKRSESRLQVVDKVMELVTGHFSDSTFGLAKLSRMIGYSEPYLSSLFHTTTGEHFSRYLERVRLAEACRLLEHKKLPSEQIAIQVGYGSANAFRRAFKKIYSLTPGEFRDRTAVNQGKS